VTTDPLRPLLGVAAFVAVGFAFSASRRSIRWRIVFGGVALQFLLALLFFRVPVTVEIFEAIARVVATAIGAAEAGARFAFGSLADPGGPAGFVFAFRVVPVIIFFASLMAVLYRLGLMQAVVGGLAWALRRTLGVSGAEALVAASNVLLGQGEAPLAIRPYLPRLTRSQLMITMTGGFATIAGSVLGGYVAFLGGENEELRVLYTRHFLTASLMSAPAAFVMAKLLVPETRAVPDERGVAAADLRPGRNLVDAAALGAGEGLRLALGVIAMLVAFVSLLALADVPLREFGNLEAIRLWREANGYGEFGIAATLGFLFTPVAWLLGVASPDVATVGSLLGTQIVATEFTAFVELGRLKAEAALDPRSAVIATYALCGFANIPAIAIQIGALGAVVPERREEIVALAPKAMAAGAMACWMTGAVAALTLPGSAFR
jgi:CNT family concentrative nucleoside transporter